MDQNNRLLPVLYSKVFWCTWYHIVIIVKSIAQMFITFTRFKYLVFYFLLWSPVERYCGCQDPDGGNSCNGSYLFRPEFLTNKLAHLLSLILFLAYIEAYVYHEEDIDQADVDKYEKTSLGFMDYDVSNIFRHIQNLTRHVVQQCQAQGLVFCPWLGSIKDRTGMCKTNRSKFLAGWIKGFILGPQLLSF